MITSSLIGNINQMRSLSIIIPNYNGEDLLKNYLPSVVRAATNYSGVWEIIVVDDLSKDSSQKILKELAENNSRIKIKFNTINLGFSGTCNEGIQLATGEVLFLLNNDVTIPEDFFQYFNQYFDNNSTFAVTAKGYRMSNSEILDGAKLMTWKRGMPRVTVNKYENEFKQEGKNPPYPSLSVQGAYFFADAAKMRELNSFDELFAPYIFEETDLAYRAMKRGWKIYYEPRCVAHHALSATISKKKKATVQVISLKNKILFVWKNIHSKNLLASHFLFLAFRLITFNLKYWKATYGAIKELPQVSKKRAYEKKNSVIDDMTILKTKI